MTNFTNSPAACSLKPQACSLKPHLDARQRLTYPSPRMFILYRYLLRQFVQIFLICFCSMDGLYIVIDAFTNLEEFSAYGEKHAGVFLVMGKYYAYRSLSFFDATSGIVALIAAMFTFALFQRFNELTALLAAGIPQAVARKRIIQPIVFLRRWRSALLAAASRELLIPAVRDKLALDSHDLGGERAKELHPGAATDKTDIPCCKSKQTLAKTRQIFEPSFYAFSRVDGHAVPKSCFRPRAAFLCSRPAARASERLSPKRPYPAEGFGQTALDRARRRAGYSHAARLSLAERRRMFRRQRYHLRATCRSRLLAAVRLAPRISVWIAEPEALLAGADVAMANPCPTRIAAAVGYDAVVSRFAVDVAAGESKCFRGDWNVRRIGSLAFLMELVMGPGIWGRFRYFDQPHRWRPWPAADGVLEAAGARYCDVRSAAGIGVRLIFRPGSGLIFGRRRGTHQQSLRRKMCLTPLATTQGK